MSVLTPNVRTNRSGEKSREIHDSTLRLYEKLLGMTQLLSKEGDKASFDAKAKVILDRESGDNQTNRLEMLQLMLKAQKQAAHEAEKAQIEAQALVEYQACIAPVTRAWQEANDAWTAYVRAENDKGHDGQAAALKGFFLKFAEVEPLVVNVRGNEEMVASLAGRLEALTAEVKAFSWDKFCSRCGSVVDMITPKNGKPAFTPKLCGTCYRAEPTDDTVAEAKVKHHKVAKPGSAQKRHKGVAKKPKGKLSAKDEAKNAELLAEAGEVAHMGKPNTKQPAKTKKAGTKTKTKKQGLGS